MPGIAVIAGRDGEGKEKAPSTFSSPGRLGSPPPELPNHEMDIKILFVLCKRHFGNSVSGKLSRG
jgi:hypothetical protein